MKLQEPLTKERFFQRIKAVNPLAMEHFCKWIDEYKRRVGWGELFNAGLKGYSPNYEEVQAPKFHELLYDFQLGIFTNYAREFQMKKWTTVSSFSLQTQVIVVFTAMELQLTLEKLK